MRRCVRQDVGEEDAHQPDTIAKPGCVAFACVDQRLGRKCTFKQQPAADQIAA